MFKRERKIVFKVEYKNTDYLESFVQWSLPFLVDVFIEFINRKSLNSDKLLSSFIEKKGHQMHISLLALISSMYCKKEILATLYYCDICERLFITLIKSSVLISEWTICLQDYLESYRMISLWQWLNVNNNFWICSISICNRTSKLKHVMQMFVVWK